MESSPSTSRPLLSLAIDGLYILLEDKDQNVQHEWHWSFYLHRGPSSGWLFHVSRPTGTWTYDHKTTDQVIYSQSVAAALRIGVIEPDMHESLRDRLAQVPLEDTARFGDLTCRTWLLRAVEELDNEGYISLVPGITVETIEQEASDAAIASSNSTGPKEKTSQYSIA